MWGKKEKKKPRQKVEYIIENSCVGPENYSLAHIIVMYLSKELFGKRFFSCFFFLKILYNTSILYLYKRIFFHRMIIRPDLFLDEGRWVLVTGDLLSDDNSLVRNCTARRGCKNGRKCTGSLCHRTRQRWIIIRTVDVLLPRVHIRPSCRTPGGPLGALNRYKYK